MQLKVCIVVDGQIKVIGVKEFIPVSIQASKWVREEVCKFKTIDRPQTTNGITIVDSATSMCGSSILNALGYFHNNANSPYYNAQFIGLYSTAFSCGHGLSVIPENFMKVCALFTARKSIKGTWLNQKDEYSAPNVDHVDYEQWNYDAIIYSLFNNSSNQSALRDVIYKGSKYDINNEFFFIDIDKMRELANDYNFIMMYRDTDNEKNRYVYDLLKNINLSNDALDVLNMAKNLWELSMKKREEYHNIYPELNLQCWDAGWVQVKKLLKEYYPNELNKFRELYNVFDKRMREGVYKFRFLPNESIKEVDGFRYD